MRPLLLHYVKLNSNPPVNGILKRKLRILSSKDGRRFNDLFYCRSINGIERSFLSETHVARSFLWGEKMAPLHFTDQAMRPPTNQTWHTNPLQTRKCWGGLVAHCAGFAIVATLASLQEKLSDRVGWSWFVLLDCFSGTEGGSEDDF